MLRKLPERLVDDIAVRAIRCTVRISIRRGWFPPSELEDLTHDVVVQLLRKMNCFDPTRSSWPTFCTMVARHFLASEARRRQKRMCADSLQDMESSDSTTRVEDSIEDQHATGRCFTRQRSSYERFELREDVSEIVGDLADPLREFCEAYLEESSFSKVAESLGVSRKTVYRRRETVREFVSEDLQEYQYDIGRRSA